MTVETTKLFFVEGAAAATPGAAKAVIYAKADGLMYSKDDAGVETLMSSGPAGSGIAATIFDAKGDIIAATAADTAARLAVGATNGFSLQVASGEATGLKWAYPGLTSTSATLGADVTMTNANTFYDGPSASLATGTWLVWGKAAIAGAGSATQQHVVRLVDSAVATFYAETEFSDQGTGNGYVQSATAFAVITLGTTTTIKIQAAAIRAGCTMKRNTTVNSASTNAASYLLALRIA